MKSWILGKMRGACLGLAMLSVAGFLSSTAQASAVHNVTVTKGPGWVRVNVHGGGAYRVHELPVGSSAYRSIAIDVPNGYVGGGLEPKNRVPVNEGLVAQVRVKQMRGFLRVYVDVISFPKYQTTNDGSGLALGIDAYHMRNGNPIAPKSW